MIDQIKSALPPVPQKTKRVYGKDYRSTEVPVASDDEEWIADHQFDWSGQHKGELLVIKGFNALTLVPPKTVTARRPIQIILQSHKTTFDALAGFDLDCCSVGWDGKEVVAVPRAVRALALGANLLDVKLARKGDPTSSIVSSRSLKYLTRGVSLALPTAAQSVLVAAGLDLKRLLKTGRDKAASETERKKLKTDDMSGLAGTLRREWNIRNGIGGGRDVAPFGAFLLSLCLARSWASADALPPRSQLPTTALPSTRGTSSSRRSSCRCGRTARSRTSSGSTLPRRVRPPLSLLCSWSLTDARLSCNSGAGHLRAPRRRQEGPRQALVLVCVSLPLPPRAHVLGS